MLSIWFETGRCRTPSKFAVSGVVRFAPGNFFRINTCRNARKCSVANKRLTPWLNPLDATLTKNTEGGGSPVWYRPATSLTEQTGSIPDTVLRWQAHLEKSAREAGSLLEWRP